MNKAKRSVHALCPECDTRVRFNKMPEEGKLVRCPECDTSLEVVSIEPLTLEWAEWSDWDDDRDYDDRDYDEWDS